MSHSNQSIVCTECNLTFRSHRALKNHQQRFHGITFEQICSNNNNNSVSSYLFQPFSTEQFASISSHACEQNRFPLGEFSSKLFSCQCCFVAFPTLNTLKYHQVHQHEHYQYELCRKILDEIILQIEENVLRTIESDDREFQTMNIFLAKQAQHVGLVSKQYAEKSRAIRTEEHRRIFPSCEHPDRTCANLCLKNLSSYDELLRTYSYRIPMEPKGSPFAQGSIVSKPSIISKETSSTNHKSKRKLTEKFTPSTDLTSPKKPLLKINHSYGKRICLVDWRSFFFNLVARSLSSMSSTSSTSTRSSPKNSRLPSTSRLKRSISPTIALAVERSSEKRRRQREQRKTKASSSSSISTTKFSHDITRENNDLDDMTSMKSKKIKQRQTSNSSVEYIQVINDDQSNIENIKLKSPSNDQDIIICHSSTPIKRPTSINGLHKTHPHQVISSLIFQQRK